MSNEVPFGRNRVMVVYQDELHADILTALKLYAVEVLTADIGGGDALRTIEEPVDYLIFDWRVTDLTGVGFIFARRLGQLIPQLIMHDDRPGWEPDRLDYFKGRFDIVADVNARSVPEIIYEFFALNRLVP